MRLLLRGQPEKGPQLLETATLVAANPEMARISQELTPSHPKTLSHPELTPGSAVPRTEGERIGTRTQVLYVGFQKFEALFWESL